MADEKAFEAKFGFAPSPEHLSKTRGVEQAIVNDVLGKFRVMLAETQGSLKEKADQVASNSEYWLEIRSNVKNLESMESDTVQTITECVELARSFNFSA